MCLPLAARTIILFSGWILISLHFPLLFGKGQTQGIREISKMSLFLSVDCGDQTSAFREDEFCIACYVHGCVSDQWLFLVPVKGGIGSIFHPPEGKDYKWYISGIFPANWGMDYATYHLLREPKITIDLK